MEIGFTVRVFISIFLTNSMFSHSIIRFKITIYKKTYFQERGFHENQFLCFQGNVYGNRLSQMRVGVEMNLPRFTKGEHPFNCKSFFANRIEEMEMVRTVCSCI